MTDSKLAIGFPVTGWEPPPLPRQESLEGSYCRLERLDPEDHGPALFDAFAGDTDGVDWIYLPYGPFTSSEELQEWLQNAATKSDPMFYTVIDPQGTAMGIASYLRITPASGSIEVGHIHFSPRLQKTPAGTEAMYLMMKQAFDLGYRRYEWKCDALNQRSCRAALRLGFSFEGIFRQATVYKGRNRDTAWYATIDQEWPQLKAAFEAWLDPANFDDAGVQKKSLSEMTAPILISTH